MSLSGSSASRKSIWAMTRLASSSSMNVGKKMMRSLSRREKTPNGGDGALTRAGDLLDLGVDLGLGGGEALALRDGLKEQGPPHGLLRAGLELGDDLAEIPLGGVGVEALAPHALSRVLHLVGD